MIPKRRQQMANRWAAIDKELSSISEGKVMPSVVDLAGREGELLLEQDALEYELGQSYFEHRNTNKG